MGQKLTRREWGAFLTFVLTMAGLLLVSVSLGMWLP